MTALRGMENAHVAKRRCSVSGRGTKGEVRRPALPAAETVFRDNHKTVEYSAGDVSSPSPSSLLLSRRVSADQLGQEDHLSRSPLSPPNRQ